MDKVKGFLEKVRAGMLLGAAMLFVTKDACASTYGTMPWDSTLSNIETDLQGPVAHGLIIIAIVVTGLMWAFGEHGSSMRKIMGIAAGGSIALGAASFISGLGMSSGAVIGW
ncbi:MAG: TrbC/VirB2 family protein [Betaproteobacteria bacterium]|nr:TrbC/VirB2 family protein [Betaproteobacteria bacterium]